MSFLLASASLFFTVSFLIFFCLTFKYRKDVKKLKIDKGIYSDLLSYHEEGMIVFDEHDFIQTSNRAAQKYLGFTLEELKEKKVSDLFSFSENRLPTKKNFDFLKTKSGSTHSIRYKCKRLSSDHANQFLLLFYIDKSKKEKKATTGLFQESILPQLILNGPQITACNHSACTLLDKKFEDIIHQNIDTFITNDTDEQKNFWDECNTFLEENQFFQTSWMLQNKSINVFIFQIKKAKNKHLMQVICLPHLSENDTSKLDELFLMQTRNGSSDQSSELFTEGLEFNESLLDHLKTLHKENFEQFIAVYFDTIDYVMHQIDQSIHSKDKNQLYHEAHYLKSLSSTIGLNKLYHIANQLEATSTENILDEALPIYERATKELEKAKNKVFTN